MLRDKAPLYKIILRGIEVYFWVDRLRRNLAYWEVSINRIFSICLIFIFSFVFSISFFFNTKVIDLLKLGVGGFIF